MNVQLVQQDGFDRVPETTGTQTQAAAQGAPVVLPPIRAAYRWDAATDALLAALEAEEASALAQLEAARERARAARRAAGALRQVRQAIRTEANRPILTPPCSSGGKSWAKEHEACIVCGTTTRPHSGQGRCGACAQYRRATGVDRPERLWRRTES